MLGNFKDNYIFKTLLSKKIIIKINAYILAPFEPRRGGMFVEKYEQTLPPI